MLPRCVEETEVLNVHRVLDQQVDEEDGADEGEGEGEDAGAGQQEQRRHVTIGQPNVVVLTDSIYILSKKMNTPTVLMVLL